MNTKINSFFSGIGGFDLAFNRTGFSTQLLCEINPFCARILERHWPNVMRFGDINDVSSKDIPYADVWCGGFPCQDISLARGASKRLGLHGSRSGLFYKFANLVEKCLPEVVLIENVGGLFNSNKGRDFGVILKTMTSFGYSVAWRLLNSRYFGVPQSRSRVYLCCWHQDPVKALKVMFDYKGAEKPANERVAFITAECGANGYPIVPQVAYCLAATSGRHTGTDWSRTYVVSEMGVRRLSPLESERLQGFPDNWTLSDNKFVNDENEDTLRYTAIGNAVTIPVVEWIASRIKKELEEASINKDIEGIIAGYKDFHGKEWKKYPIACLDLSDDEKKYEWSKSGLIHDGYYIECDASPTPSKIVTSSLLDLIEPEQNILPHYYLTPNAAKGILRRVDNQKRTLFKPLRTALERLGNQDLK